MTSKQNTHAPTAALNTKPTVISTFAGTGGSSLGYHLAGFRELAAVEYDENACVNFSLNFPDVYLFNRDIREVTAEEIFKVCSLKKGDLDIFDGSPPCQGFSMAGKREVGDNRNNLFLAYTRLLCDLKPKVFVMENVKGMVIGKMKGRFLEIRETLKDQGYKVKVKLMNAKFYGVPQSRERVIFIGVRNDIPITPSFPQKSNKITTVRQALKDVEPGEKKYLSGKYAELWAALKPGKNGSSLINSAFQMVKIHPDKPSPTITKTSVASGFASMCHWEEPRLLTINEVKKLSSFPQDFNLQGKRAEQWARMGNCVPPLMMKAIANHIKTEILNKI